jgi:hypothetical protein
MLWKWISLVALGSLFAGGLATPTLRAHDNSVDDHMFKINSFSQALTTRAALVRFVWGTDWSEICGRFPNVITEFYAPTADDALPSHLSNLDQIEKLVCTLSEPLQDGSTLVHSSTAFVFHPVNRNGRVVVVHHGHGCRFDGRDDNYNLGETVRELLSSGFSIVAMRMPLFQSPLQCGTTHEHDLLMQRQLKTGSPLIFFLEPVARVLNYLERARSEYHEFNMIGLSGGGWTTTIYAALDPRIVQSFPVAGSIPLYLRGHGYQDDAEQYYAPFYAIAGYKDMYLLGSLEAGRRQTQILNRHDDCCFGEQQHTVGPPPYTEAMNAYAQDVESTMFQIGAGGTFRLVIDQTAHTHQISRWAIETEILPDLMNYKYLNVFTIVPLLGGALIPTPSYRCAY